MTKIGDSAFRDCSSLESIKIPDSLTWIEDSAFAGCSSLKSIDIPDSVTRIENDAFKECGFESICLHIKSPNSAIEIMEKVPAAPSTALYVPIGTGYAYRHHYCFSFFKEIVASL